MWVLLVEKTHDAYTQESEKYGPQIENAIHDSVQYGRL